MDFPLNFRWRFLAPEDMKGQPTIPVNVPNNPVIPLSFTVVPALLEILLKDPNDDMKEVWIEIPFHLQIDSIILPIESKKRGN